VAGQLPLLGRKPNDFFQQAVIDRETFKARRSAALAKWQNLTALVLRRSGKDSGQVETNFR